MTLIVLAFLFICLMVFLSVIPFEKLFVFTRKISSGTKTETESDTCNICGGSLPENAGATGNNGEPVCSETCLKDSWADAA